MDTKLGQLSGPNPPGVNPSASPPVHPASTLRPITAAPGTACLSAGLIVKGEISGHEDLHIDGKVEGQVNLEDHRLTVGVTAHLKSRVAAREVIVYGDVHGDINAPERVQIKKDGGVTGDIVTTRLLIEEGAYFKGKIEVNRNMRVEIQPEGSVVQAAKKG
jgi:cytoskeletal protein CcmA (bactofilin family)